MVLRVNQAAHSVVISHRDIQGFMPAMTMEFRAAQSESLAALGPGTRIRFQLAVSRHGSAVSRIQKLAPVAEYPRAQPPQPAIGSLIPDFTLTDEANQPVRLTGLRGQVVAIDFIYTRCPLPDVCPRLSANFRRLQRRFGNRVTLLSVTIDPLFDTPAVLARYARLWNADPVSWHFLTGPQELVQAVARSLGLLYFPEEGSLTHSSQTVVVGRDGRLAGIVEGPGYAVSQLGDLISIALESK
jgi:protein SCO1/2